MKNKRVDSKPNGFSIVEMSVTLLLLTVVLLILYELLIGTMKTSMFVEAHNDLTVYGQRMVNKLQTDIFQSRFIWEEDASIGPAYRQLFLDQLLLTPGPVRVWSDSRMPDIDPGSPPPNDGLLDVDLTGQTYVGNSLLLVKALEPVGIPADYDGDGINESTFFAERYQFKYYFLSPNPARTFRGMPTSPPFVGTNYYLDLIECESEVYADNAQLVSIFATLATPAQRQVIANGLLGLPGTITVAEARRLGVTTTINKAWMPNAIAPAAFFDLDNTATLTPDPTPTFTIAYRSMVPEMKGGRISGKMEYSVAMNRGTMDIIVPIPRFGEVNTNFPGGFEVKIVGPTGHRKVLTRVVLLSEHLGVITSQENSVITSTRQF